MTAAPVRGGFTALTYLPGGVAPVPGGELELTYLGNGKVAFEAEGGHGPTAAQLWKLTG